MQLTALLIVLPFLAAQSALGAPTVTEAKRSTTSAGATCYYTCANQFSMGSNLCFLNGGSSASSGTCSYNCYDSGFNSIAGQICQYDTNAGTPIAGGTTTSSCPTTLTQTCGGVQSSGQFRRSIPKREMTAAERVIAARQFKYTSGSQA